MENTFAITGVGFGLLDSVTSLKKDVYVIELRAQPHQSSKQVTLQFLAPAVITTPHCITFLYIDHQSLEPLQVSLTILPLGLKTSLLS